MSLDKLGTRRTLPFELDDIYKRLRDLENRRTRIRPITLSGGAPAPAAMGAGIFASYARYFTDPPPLITIPYAIYEAYYPTPNISAIDENGYLWIVSYYPSAPGKETAIFFKETDTGGLETKLEYEYDVDAQGYPTSTPGRVLQIIFDKQGRFYAHTLVGYYHSNPPEHHYIWSLGTSTDPTVSSESEYEYVSPSTYQRLYGLAVLSEGSFFMALIQNSDDGDQQTRSAFYCPNYDVEMITPYMRDPDPRRFGATDLDWLAAFSTDYDSLMFCKQEKVHMTYFPYALAYWDGRICLNPKTGKLCAIAQDQRYNPDDSDPYNAYRTISVYTVNDAYLPQSG